MPSIAGGSRVITPFLDRSKPFFKEMIQRSFLVSVLRVALTGGAGYMGSLLVKRLMDQGDGLVSVDNLMRGDYSHLRRVGAQERAEGLDGSVFNVGGETLRIGALAEMVARSLRKATGNEVEITHLPSRPGETKHFSYNLEKIEKGLGYKAGWGIEEGIEQIIRYRLEEMKIEE